MQESPSSLQTQQLFLILSQWVLAYQHNTEYYGVSEISTNTCYEHTIYIDINF